MIEYRYGWSEIEGRGPLGLVVRDGDDMAGGRLVARGDYVIVPREMFEGFYGAAQREAMGVAAMQVRGALRSERAARATAPRFWERWSLLLASPVAGLLTGLALWVLT